MMRSANASLRKRSGHVSAPHMLTSQSHVPFTLPLHGKHFCTVPIILFMCQDGKIYRNRTPTTLLISNKPCIWEDAHSNLWHRLGLEEHVFPQMSGYTWQRKASGTAPLHSCDFSQLIHFMWYWHSVTQPPIKLGGKTRADGPHLMLSDCIHPSIIMQFLQMPSLRKTHNCPYANTWYTYYLTVSPAPSTSVEGVRSNVIYHYTL